MDNVQRARFHRRVLVAMVLCIATSSATGSADPIRGVTTDFYHAFEGTLSAIDVNLGAGPVSTGPISFRLDRTRPANQRFTFDFDTLAASVAVDLLVDFPLLHSLGEDSLRIHISESGPIVSGRPDLPPGDSRSLAFQALLTGGGTVGPGSVFAGTVFSNLNDTRTRKTVNVAPGGTFTQTIKGGGTVTITGTVILPGGSPMPTSGGGSFTIGPNPVPEPSTLLLLGTGAAALASRIRRRKH